MLATLLFVVQSRSAKDLIGAALAAMGGSDKLASISTIKAQVVGHQFMPEQSERPEGPWFNVYFDGSETADLAKGTDTWVVKARGVLFNPPSDQNATFDLNAGKQNGFVYPISMSAAVQRMALGPENLLFTALAAKDLRADGETVFHDIPQDVLTFSWGGSPVRVLLNQYSHLPSAVEVKHEGQGFWAAWGDVTDRTVWGNWDFAPGGIYYPTLWAREHNDLQQDNMTLSGLEVSYGAARDAAWGESISRLNTGAPRPFTFKPVEIASGILQYQSGFNCAVVDQGDGLVLLDGVVSSEYVKKIEEDVRTRFPGKKIKAVVTTDDAWPHIGGLRQMVAEGVTVYALPQNRKILDRLFKSPHTIHPDDLQLHHRAPSYKFVNKRVVLGTGTNRLEIYPVHGAGTERMLFGYFPEKKIAYAPDVIQVGQGQWFSVNILSEFVAAVDREGLKPESAFAFHSGLRPFQTLRDKVSETRAK